MGAAINTPAPGRASAPPGRRGRIPARTACCAGTQNTSQVTALRPGGPLRPAPTAEPGRCQPSQQSAGHFPDGEHILLLASPSLAGTHQSGHTVCVPPLSCSDRLVLHGLACGPHSPLGPRGISHAGSKHCFDNLFSVLVLQEETLSWVLLTPPTLVQLNRMWAGCGEAGRGVFLCFLGRLRFCLSLFPTASDALSELVTRSCFHLKKVS